MKGGARLNSGPAPDPNALRRDRPSDQQGWTVLPRDGFQGATPEWPLVPDVVMAAKRDMALAEAEQLADQLAEEVDGRKQARIRKNLAAANQSVTVLDRQLEAQRDLEAELWTALWRTPQACAWAELAWTRDVAQYVRHKVLGELGSLKDAQEARQWSDRLGLNPTAMLRNRWKVGTAGAEKLPADAPKRAARASAKTRMRVVRPDERGT